MRGSKGLYRVMLASVALAFVAGCGGTDGERTARQDPTRQDAVAGAETIRKQVTDLRPSDLEQFPIWEHALDEEGEPGQDEETVKPRPDLTVADPGEGRLIARAELVAKDGTRYDGYVYPSDEQHMGFIQPTIVTDEGQVNFWYGLFPPKPGALDAGYELLGKTAEELFPVTFRALVEYEGVSLEGEIPAFLHYADRQPERIVEVK
jgi:hypothetical protein